MRFRLVLFIFLSGFLSVVTTLSARDFSYTFKGQEIILTVIDDFTKTCVTKAGSKSLQATSGMYVYAPGNVLAGDLELPAHPKDGDISYTLIGIAPYSFANNSDLHSITFPNTITEVGEGAFYGCGFIQKVEFESISDLCRIDFKDFTANPLSSTGHLYIDGKEIDQIIIPESVDRIGDYAFWGCADISWVIIPNSVKSFGNQAFYTLKGLQDVYYNTDTPIEADITLFNTLNYSATLHVPEKALAAAKITSPWRYFLNIVGEKFDGIDNATAAARIDFKSPYEVFDLGGMQINKSLDRLSKGIYIIRQGGKCLKILVR